jgi:hypothetical protein
MQGEKNYNTLATAVQFMWAIDNKTSFNNSPSPDQLKQTLADHPGLRDALDIISTLAGRYRLSRGYIAGAYYLCAKYSEPMASMYVDSLTSGLNIQSTSSPIARLRRAFEDHKANLKGMRLQNTHQAALFIKGFNNMIKGRSGPLSWRATGPAAEAFPRVGG